MILRTVSIQSHVPISMISPFPFFFATVNPSFKKPMESYSMDTTTVPARLINPYFPSFFTTYLLFRYKKSSDSNNPIYYISLNKNSISIYYNRHIFNHPPIIASQSSMTRLDEIVQSKVVIELYAHISFWIEMGTMNIRKYHVKNKITITQIVIKVKPLVH